MWYGDDDIGGSGEPWYVQIQTDHEPGTIRLNDV